MIPRAVERPAHLKVWFPVEIKMNLDVLKDCADALALKWPGRYETRIEARGNGAFALEVRHRE